jgi:predicted nucleic acid-binding Zn ribbon protein
MNCEGCGKEIEPRHPRGRFCSGRCRTLAWKRSREAAARAPLERALRRVVGLLEEAGEEIRAALTEREGEGQR